MGVMSHPWKGCIPTQEVEPSICPSCFQEPSGKLFTIGPECSTDVFLSPSSHFVGHRSLEDVWFTSPSVGPRESFSLKVSNEYRSRTVKLSVNLPQDNDVS